MKKRVFSLFMALALCLSMLPAAAMADTGTGESSGSEKHEHYLCGATGESHSCSSTWDTKYTFTAWTDELAAEQWNSNEKTASNSLPRWSSASYYLTKNVELEAEDSYSPWSGGGITLCLNGHNITMKGDKDVISVSGTFTLVDCKGDTGKYGEITHASGSGHGVEMTGGTFNMYGGNITGNNTSSYGGGVSMTGKSTFNMYGGQITENTAHSGGGVYSDRDSNSECTFNMYDGEISGNTATMYGGGVCIGNSSTFNMSGGQITDNNCISGDNTKRGGGGVYVGGTMTVSGEAKITDNVRDGNLNTDTGKYTGGTANNVYLNGSKTIAIDGELTGEIGVTKKFTTKETVYVATGADEETNYTDIIVSDNDTYKVAHDSTDGTKLVLVENTPAPAEEHKHCICGETHTNVGDHTSESQTTFEKKLWMDGDTLKMGDKEWTLGEVERADSSSGDKEEGYALSEGTYYLGTDLKLNGTPILIGGDVKLCLNGHTIDQAYRSGAISSLIRVVGKNAHLTLTDCVGGGKLTGGQYGGVDVFGGCTLDMFGGTITDNKIQGGVIVGQAGVFNMYGGSIMKNTASSGGGVYNGGTVNMYGGEISGNKATTFGGGVYVAESYGHYQGGILTVSGSAKITGNTVDNAANNVYLPSGKTFTLGSHFTKDTYIGVTTAEKPTDKKHVTIVSNAGTMSYDNVVKADDSENYKTQMDGADLVLAVKNGGTHEHVWDKYVKDTDDESKINLFCSGCNESGGWIKITAPTNCTYTGNSIPAELEISAVWKGGRDFTNAIEYSDINDFSPQYQTAPKDIGRYHAYLTLGEDNNSAQVCIEYEITKGGSTGKVDAGVKITAENANDPAPTEVVYGDTFKLGATLQTTGTAGSPQSSKWTWTSSDPDVLSVTDNGSAATVKALKVGTATITVTYESEKAKGTATATITVNQRQISVKVDDKEMTVGGALPTFTVTYGNFASGDTADTVLETKTPSTEADGKTAGSFDITVEAPTIKSNYADRYTVGTPQKGTLAVNAAENPPQPSSGGSSRPSYSVSTPGKTENGSVSADVKNAKKGSTVTITVKPEDGFKLADLTVTDKNGNELALTDKGDGKYTFTMPAGKVEISAAFAEEIETSPFEDVAADAYYYEAVKWAAEQGITEGTGKGLFGPEGTCTRGQIVTFLWRAAGSPVVNYAMDLADVDEDAYYAEAVRWALSEGVTSGTTDTTFAPDATCTRAQAMTFLFKAMKAAAEGKADFKDVADSDWFASAVAWAVENGVTAGVGGGLFGPDNDCTRGQIVTFLWKLYAGK